jgi:hypothetical protein
VTRRTLGLALMVLGGVLVIVAIIGLIVGGGGPVEPVAASTTTTTPSTTAPATTKPATTTTTQAPATTPTMTIVESTTTLATTTTTPDPVAAIEAFVPEFAGMIAAGDTQGLLDTLHPAVLDTQDADLCRTYIEREILALVDYRLTGAVTGPVPTTFGSTTVDVYSGPVSFTYQGEAFDSTATFALVDGHVRWFTTCR